MNTLSKFLTLAAASTVLAAVPAAADPYYDRGPWNGPGWVDDGYDRPGPYGYDRPGYYGYGRPDYEVGSTVTAICPPGYHLGRSGRLCWPN